MTRIKPIEIIIADDHPLIRYSLKLAIGENPGYKITGEASNGKELISLALSLKPNIIIVDIKMPVMDGISATRQLAVELPETAIIALSVIDEEDLIIEMLQAGAKGFLRKDVMVEEVMVAIEMVHNGKYYFSRQVSDAITGRVARGDLHSSKKQQPDFSEKELAIIKLISREFSTKQIADHLKITKRSVDGLRENILKKIDAKKFSRDSCVCYEK